MTKSQTFTGLRTAHGPLSAFRSTMKEGVAEYMLAVLELSEKLMLTFLTVAEQDSWIPTGPDPPPSRDRSQIGDGFPRKHLLVLCLLHCSAWTLSLTAGPPLQPTPTAIKLTSLPMMSPGWLLSHPKANFELLSQLTHPSTCVRSLTGVISILWTLT